MSFHLKSDLNIEKCNYGKYCRGSHFDTKLEAKQTLDQLQSDASSVDVKKIPEVYNKAVYETLKAILEGSDIAYGSDSRAASALKRQHGEENVSNFLLKLAFAELINCEVFSKSTIVDGMESNSKREVNWRFMRKHWGGESWALTDTLTLTSKGAEAMEELKTLIESSNVAKGQLREEASEASKREESVQLAEKLLPTLVGLNSKLKGRLEAIHSAKRSWQSLYAGETFDTSSLAAVFELSVGTARNVANVFAEQEFLAKVNGYNGQTLYLRDQLFLATLFRLAKLHTN